MSVINQMLRDLDARQASAQERAGLPTRLRTLPPVTVTRSATWRLLALGMLAGALITGLLASWYFAPAAPPLPAPVTMPATLATPAVATATAENTPAALAPTAAVPLPAPTDPVEITLPPLLALAEPAAPPTAPHVAALSPPAPATAATLAEPARRVAKPRSTEPRLPRQSEPAVTPPALEAASVEAQIDKHVKGGQARDMAESDYRKAMQAVKHGDNATALPQFQRALELDPTLAKARQALLSMLVGGRQWTEARQVAQSGLALDPARTGWAAILARLQFEQGDAPAALETLERHAAHAGGDADYQGFHAYLLQKQQRPAEAAKRFQAALALRPQEGRWWFGLGLAQDSAGNADAARQAYAKAKEVGNLTADMLSVIEQKLR